MTKLRILSAAFLALLVAACTSGNDGRTGDSRKEAPPAVVHRSRLPLVEEHLSRGQLVYAPVYSELEFVEESTRKLSAANLSVRNTSEDFPITVNFVDYYHDHGGIIRNYLEAPLVIEPMGSRTFLIRKFDTSAGSGANFLVEWTADSLVSNPVIETVMISFQGPRGLAFRSPGVVLRSDSRRRPE